MKVAPVGTVAVMRMSEFTVRLAAEVPLNTTFVACVRPVPLMLTDVPTGPLVGLKLAMDGSTLNVCGLVVNVVEPVVTVTAPVSAPAGTVAVMNVVPVSTMVVAWTTGRSVHHYSLLFMQLCKTSRICAVESRTIATE